MGCITCFGGEEEAGLQSVSGTVGTPPCKILLLAIWLPIFKKIFYKGEQVGAVNAKVLCHFRMFFQVNEF